MKTTLYSFIAICFVSTQIFAQTQTLENPAAAHTQATQITSMLVDQKYTEAFEILKKYWPLEGYQIDGLKETTAKQLPLLEDSFGKLLGYEFVRSETLGTFGHVEFFVLKYEKNALRLYLTYYNGGNGWLINSLQWDDRWDYLFLQPLKNK